MDKKGILVGGIPSKTPVNELRGIIASQEGVNNINPMEELIKFFYEYKKFIAFFLYAISFSIDFLLLGKSKNFPKSSSELNSPANFK